MLQKPHLWINLAKYQSGSEVTLWYKKLLFQKGSRTIMHAIKHVSFTVCGNGMAFRQSRNTSWKRAVRRHCFLSMYKPALYEKVVHVFVLGGNLLSFNTNWVLKVSCLREIRPLLWEQCPYLSVCLKMPPVCVHSPWWPTGYSGSRFWSPVWSCRTGQSFPPGAGDEAQRLSQIFTA